jgi:hypothetical protein
VLGSRTDISVSRVTPELGLLFSGYDIGYDHRIFYEDGDYFGLFG